LISELKPAPIGESTLALLKDAFRGRLFIVAIDPYFPNDEDYFVVVGDEKRHVDFKLPVSALDIFYNDRSQFDIKFVRPALTALNCGWDID
jgi:hypothetical protein